MNKETLKALHRYGFITKPLRVQIAKSAEWSYRYALNVLEGPFELGEPEIAKSAEWSYRYARLFSLDWLPMEACLSVEGPICRKILRVSPN